MVKLSLFRTIFNSEKVENKENSTIVRTKPRRRVSRMDTSAKNSYRPKWRKLCDEWVDTRLEERQGVTTPVHVLYNTFLKENPGHYMDIAQFGKVLKSRFRNQKCRRGGQGAQIYVYKNVAIKDAQETKSLCADAATGGTPSLAGERATPSPLPLQAVPQDEVTPDPHPRLALTGTLTSSDCVINTTAPIEANKRKMPREFMGSAIIPKKRKYIFETDFSQSPISGGVCAESGSIREDHSVPVGASDPVPPSGGDEGAVRCSEASGATQVNSHVSNTSNDVGFGGSGSLSRNKHWSPALIEDSGGTTLLNLDTFSLNLGLKRINTKKNTEVNEIFQENVPRTIEPSNIIIKNTDCDPNPPQINDKRVSDVKKADLDEKHNSYLQTSTLSYSQHSARSPRPTSEDGASGRSGRDSPEDSQGLTCRMAIGRKWVDDQLVEKVGARTFAWEVAAAYARDHPDEPLPDTSIAVLIRNKFPNRRKAHKKGAVTIYYFQDLELVNREGLSDNLDVGEGSLNSAASSPRPQGAPTDAATFVTKDGKPIAVVNPPAESVFLLNGVPCVELKLTSSGVTIIETKERLGREGSASPLHVVSTRSDDLSHEALPQVAEKEAQNFDAPQNISYDGDSQEQIPVHPDAFLPQGNDTDPFKFKIKQESSRDGLEHDSHSDMYVEEYIRKLKREDIAMGGEVKPPMVNMSPLSSGDERYERFQEFPQDLTRVKDARETTPPEGTTSNDEKIKTGIQRQRSKTWDADMRKFACASKTSGEDAIGNESKRLGKRKKARKAIRQDEGLVLRIKDDLEDSQLVDAAAACDAADHFFNEGRKDAIKRVVLDTAFRLLSEEGSSLPEGERARRLESAFYERNPAVEYKETLPWPMEDGTEDAEQFPCRTTRSLMEVSSLAPGDATQLLYHHQSCPGQGCTYNDHLCLTLRAAYTHVAIFRHRCQVWHYFTKVLARHAASCGTTTCPILYCRFSKHELCLQGASLKVSEVERKLLQEEFRVCEALGGHQGDLQCLHEQRILLPVPNPSFKGERQTGTHGVESRGLEVAGKLLLEASPASFTAPLFNTLQVAAAQRCHEDALR